MDLFTNLLHGFSILADPMVIVYSLVGVVCGVVIGALPGLGPSVGIAVLLPMCYSFGVRPALCVCSVVFTMALCTGGLSLRS